MRGSPLSPYVEQTQNTRSADVTPLSNPLPAPPPALFLPGSPLSFPLDRDWVHGESRNRCFRLLGSSKFGKSAALRVAETNRRPLKNMVWRGKGGVLPRASSPQPRDVARTLLVSEGIVADEVIASSVWVLAKFCR